MVKYFEVVRYVKLSNEYKNLSGLTIWGLQVDYTRNVNMISIIKGFLGVWNSFMTTKNATNSANFREGNKGASEKLRYVRVSTNFALQVPRKTFLYIHNKLLN